MKYKFSYGNQRENVSYKKHVLSVCIALTSSEKRQYKINKIISVIFFYIYHRRDTLEARELYSVIFLKILGYNRIGTVIFYHKVYK